MTDLEIYIDGFNDKGIQIANAFLDVMRYKLNELGADSTDVFTKIFDISHIETEQYYLNILSVPLPAEYHEGSLEYGQISLIRPAVSLTGFSPWSVHFWR